MSLPLRKHIQARIEPDLRVAIEQAASVEKASVSEWLRRALRQVVSQGSPRLAADAQHQAVG